MGDGFFKIFFISCFFLLFAAGAIMFLQMEAESEDRLAVRKFIDARGNAPIPRSWRDEIGKGI